MREWQQVALKYGPGWALALVLSYYLFIEVRADQRMFRNEHASISTELGNTRMAVQKFIDTNTDQQILWVLQTMCINDARTEQQRERCLSRIEVLR